MWSRIHLLIQHRPKTVLFFIFLLTVIVRLPQLTRPLSKHHELNTAAVLICLQVWNEQGVIPSKAAPIQYFPGNYNILHDEQSSFKRLNNSGAYLSMGAGSYLLPWLGMKLFHIAPSPLPLRQWMLLIELISVYLLYSLLLFLKESLFTEYKSFAFIGCLLFLTAPVVMWYMGNSYSHETMVMPFYLLILRYGFIIHQKAYRRHAKQYIGYGLCVALAVYTDWLGAIIALVFFLQAISFKNFQQRIPFLLISILSVLTPLVIVFWQYISLVGWKEYSAFIAVQLHRRSLPGTDVQYSIIDYLKNFFSGYGALCITAIIGLLVFRKRLNRYLLITAAIPLLHYLLFRGFSNEHDYAVLKWSPFLIITALMGLHQMSIFWQKAALIFIIASSVILYHFINLPFSTSRSGERYAWMKNAGQRIATEAKPDEYIFINTEGYLHQVAWYAQRNYKPVKDTAEARKWLQQQPGNKAVFFILNKQQHIEKIIRITR